MNIKSIEFETTKKDLTHLSGLVFYQKLVKNLGLSGQLANILSDHPRLRDQSASERFLTGIYSLIAGADCIEDLALMRRDTLFREVSHKSCSPVTMARFIKNITPKSHFKLTRHLPQLAHKLRSRLYPNDPLIISMDATDHVQYGEQMEGVEWNYKEHRCLSSQNAFDQFGFCYGFKLRSGATHSSVGAVEMIDNIFRFSGHRGEKFFRADSAYATKDIYNSLLNHKVNFGICLGENAWRSLLNRFGSKIKWQKTGIYFFKSSKCEVGSCLYPLKDLQGRGFLRVVFIRAPKKNRSPEDHEYYRYYAIVTNMNSHEANDEAVFKFYIKRANVENQIKDLKGGMDFRHFPCRELKANHAWGMMGIYAYNLMRFCAQKLYPRRGCFLKTVRKKMLYIASEIRKGQRKIKLRFTNHMLKEVQSLDIMITQLGFYRSGLGGQAPPS